MYKINKAKMAAAMMAANVATAKELSEKTNISRNTISRINNGGSAKIPTIKIIAEALNCSPADLIEGAKD